MSKHKQTKAVPFSIKTLAEDGTFEGYAAVFGNVDLGGDVLLADSMKEFVTNSDGKLVVLWQHDPGSPIATASYTQDSTGLRVKGQFLLGDPVADRAYLHAKAKTVEGMSFGYDILPGGAKINKSGVRELSAVKVWEVSLATFPMNPAAGLTAVKSARADIREFEAFLRDAGGFSRSDAKALASGGWKALKGLCDADEVPTIDLAPVSQALQEAIDSIRKLTN